MMTTRSNVMRMMTASLACLMLVGLGLISGPPAGAVVKKSDLPSAAQIKASLRGLGKWQRGVGEPDFRPLGARPSECRSDLPFAQASETRSAFYFGPVRGTRKYHGIAEIVVYRFATPEAAAAAVTTASGYAQACPTSTEWVCEACDGIWAYDRTPAAARSVGEQSVAWNQRATSLGVSRGRVIVARSAALVVVTYTAHETDPTRLKYPPAPRWKRAISVTRKALGAAS